MLGAREDEREGKSVYDGKGTEGLSKPKLKRRPFVVPLGETDIGDLSCAPND